MIGEVGELVITEPMPSMPVGSGTTTTARGCASRTSRRIPGVWRHGDWIKIDDGRLVRHLRSNRNRPASPPQSKILLDRT